MLGDASRLRYYRTLPVSAPPQTLTQSKGSILLVEEYPALASALGSALQKFAPRHAVRIAPSLSLAEELGAQAAPDLLIVDFDPPLTGALDFFGRVQRLLPDTRVLVIAAGLPRDILHERRPPTAFEFFEKPFQLPAFGEAVQRLLESTDPASLRGAGTLGDLHLMDLIPLICLGGLTEVLKVSATGEDQRGAIHFARGQIQHIAASGLEGIDALREMLRWASPDFAAAEETSEASAPMEGPWPAILRQVLRSIPSRPPLLPPSPARRRPRPAYAGPASEPKPAVVKDGKKIVVIDDTETLLDFVVEMLSAADPRLQIVAASNAIEGLSQCASFRPDLILLDYCLPDFNGDEVCRRLLRDGQTRETPVIMMSGHVPEITAAAAQYENIVQTLPKPFVSRDLIAAVENVFATTPKAKRRRAVVLPPTPRPAPMASAPVMEPQIKIERKANGEKSLVTATAVLAPPPAVTAPLSRVEARPILTRAEVALTPTRIPGASRDAVVISIPLEVLAMKFSPALRVTAIRARPCSPVASLRIDPRAAPVGRLPEASVEIDQVNLDSRGQMQTLRAVPVERPSAPSSARTAVAIEHLEALPSPDSGGIQLIPAPGAPLIVHLLMSFDLVGVKLSPEFSVEHLGLKALGGRVRAILPGGGGNVGITFETAQILLDRSARIAEILLDSVVG